MVDVLFTSGKIRLFPAQTNCKCTNVSGAAVSGAAVSGAPVSGATVSHRAVSAGVCGLVYRKLQVESLTIV